jgi:cell cycle checkpoint protein
VKLGANGVRFTIEEAQQFQANALLTKDMFRVFELDEGVEPMFKIAFDTLLDVLGIFGNGAGSGGGGGGGMHHGAAAASGAPAGSEQHFYHHHGSAPGWRGPAGLRMAYSSRMSDNLMVVLTSGDAKDLVETTCSLRTLECEMPMNISDLMHQKKMNQLIITAPALRDAFNELDWSSTFVELLLSPSEPFFRLSTAGKTGSCEVSFAKGSDTLSSFAVTEHQLSRYSLAYLTPAAKGLGIASTASIKTNRDGLLLIQMAIDVGAVSAGAGAGAPNLISDATPAAFVDFYVVPLVDNADDPEVPLEGAGAADDDNDDDDDDNDERGFR